jgi:hypothetical protein
MPHRLEYYLQQAEVALEEANRATPGPDRATWLRIATEWQHLHDTLTADLRGLPPGKPDPHVLDV